MKNDDGHKKMIKIMRLKLSFSDLLHQPDSTTLVICTFSQK
jgi:hypothetical protein